MVECPLLVTWFLILIGFGLVWFVWFICSSRCSAFCCRHTQVSKQFQIERQKERPSGTYNDSLLSVADFTTWAGQLNIKQHESILIVSRCTSFIIISDHVFVDAMELTFFFGVSSSFALECNLCTHNGWSNSTFFFFFWFGLSSVCITRTILFPSLGSPFFWGIDLDNNGNARRRE